MIHIYDWATDVVTTIEANKLNPMGNVKTLSGFPTRQTKRSPSEVIDYNKKCLHVAYHPTNDIVAVGASSNLFIYESLPE